MNFVNSDDPIKEFALSRNFSNPVMDWNGEIGLFSYIGRLGFSHY